MRLRQIALVSGNLDKVSAEIAAVLGLGAAFHDPAVGKYGLRNAVFPIGDTFLEVVSPRQPGTTAERLLAKRGGDGGYMVILQVNDIAASRGRAVAARARIVDQADFDGVAMTHLHPKDTGGAILSLDTMEPPERWEWGGPAWRSQVRTERVTGIVGAAIRSADPAAMAARWADILGRSCAAENDCWRITLDQGALAFVELGDGLGEGLCSVDLAVRDRPVILTEALRRGLRTSDDGVTLCGVEVRLVEGAERAQRRV